MKRICLSLALALVLCLSLAVPALAVEDYTADTLILSRRERGEKYFHDVGVYPLNQPASGDGWNYDGKNTLTLNGITDEVYSYKFDVRMNYNGQFHIVLADGTENRLALLYIYQKRKTYMTPTMEYIGDDWIGGDVTISGKGSLTLASETGGMLSCGCLTMNGGTLRMPEPYFIVYSLVMNDGTLELAELAFSQIYAYTETDNYWKNRPTELNGGTIVVDGREWADKQRQKLIAEGKDPQLPARDGLYCPVHINSINSQSDDSSMLAASNGKFVGEDSQPLTARRTTFEASSNGYLYTADGRPASYAKFSKEPAVQVGGFTDVNSGDWFADPVTWAVEKEITNGTSANKFSPKQDCTVAHILTFLWRASGSPEATKDAPFTDVKDGDWFADAAAWASEKGMVTGDTFNPNAPCTRSMAVTYMWQAAGSPEAEAASFTDVPASADYAKAVAWAVENGVTDGTSPTTFSPDTVCTRGHIVTFLYRGFGE